MVVPSSPADAKGLLLAAVADPDPVIILEPIRLYRAIKEVVPEGHYTVPIGEARVLREGADVSLMSYGAMVRDTVRAADGLAADGIDAEVLDLRSLSPLDHAAILASAVKTGRVVVVVESHRNGSVASEVAAVVQERALYSLLAPVERVTGYDTVVPLKRSETHYIPGVDRIVAAARRTLEA